MQITEKENERKLKVKRAKTNLAVLSTCWMEVFGLLNLKRHSKSPTCGTKITDRHHYYNLLKLNFDAQAFLILIPEIFASFFVADRTSIIDVRHFAWDFSKFPYIGPVSDPRPSHLQLPPFLLDFSSAQGIADLWRRSTSFEDRKPRKFSSGISEDLWTLTLVHLALPRNPRSFN